MKSYEKRTQKIKNFNQANFLIQNGGCKVVGCGNTDRALYIEFLINDDFNSAMETWRTRLMR